MSLEAIIAINIAAAILIVCWPSRKWDVRGLLEEDEE